MVNDLLEFNGFVIFHGTSDPMDFLNILNFLDFSGFFESNEFLAFLGHFRFIEQNGFI